MNCKELVYLLGDYIEGTMAEPLRSELAEHIEMCDACLGFLKTYDRTRIICRQIRPEEIPPEFAFRLKAFVMAKAAERRADIEKYIHLARDERLRDVAAVLEARAGGRLSPTMDLLLSVHAGKCGPCAAFLASWLAGAANPAPIPDGVADHLGDLIDALPPGEPPF